MTTLASFNDKQLTRPELITRALDLIVLTNSVTDRLKRAGAVFGEVTIDVLVELEGFSARLSLLSVHLLGGIEDPERVIQFDKESIYMTKAEEFIANVEYQLELSA